jgi:hypothetical protein
MKLRLALITLLSAVLLRAAEAVPLFNATLTVGKEHRFVLVDAEGKTSSFLTLGESFAGYKLKAYDVKTGVLELERDGKVTKVTLVADAAIGNGPAPAAALPATITDAEGVLNKMHFEEMMERAMAGQKKAMTTQFERMFKPLIDRGGDPQDVAAFQKAMIDEVSKVLDAKELKNDIAKVYSEVFSKQELEQIAAFYSTPTGEMLAAKQPVVQEKFGAVMQAKTMEMMPRLQKMGQEFAQQQKTKMQAGGATPPPAPAPAPTPKQ